MALKDPVKRGAYQKAYAEGHREEKRLNAIEYRATHADKIKLDQAQRRQKRKIYHDAWRLANADKIALWRAKNKAEIAAKARQWQLDHKEEVIAKRLANVEVAKWRHLLKKYGISATAYKAMLDAQHNGCDICGKPPAKDKPLVVDHNHATGAIRALLCSPCNRALGFIYDSPFIADNTAAYLRRHLPNDTRNARIDVSGMPN